MKRYFLGNGDGVLLVSSAQEVCAALDTIVSLSRTRIAEANRRATLPLCYFFC